MSTWARKVWHHAEQLRHNSGRGEIIASGNPPKLRVSICEWSTKADLLQDLCSLCGRMDPMAALHEARERARRIASAPGPDAPNTREEMKAWYRKRFQQSAALWFLTATEDCVAQ